MAALTVADQRMIAIRFEEASQWSDAAKAWRKAIDLIPPHNGPMRGTIISAMEARAVSAERLAGEPMGLVQQVGDVEAKATADKLPEQERTPDAVTHLDPGTTEGDSGAR